MPLLLAYILFKSGVSLYVFVQLLLLKGKIVIQVPWIQVSRSRSLLLMVKPSVFLAAVGMGAYVLWSHLALVW